MTHNKIAIRKEKVIDWTFGRAWKGKEKNITKNQRCPTKTTESREQVGCEDVKDIFCSTNKCLNMGFVRYRNLKSNAQEGNKNRGFFFLDSSADNAICVHVCMCFCVCNSCICTI